MVSPDILDCCYPESGLVNQLPKPDYFIGWSGVVINQAFPLAPIMPIWTSSTPCPSLASTEPVQKPIVPNSWNSMPGQPRDSHTALPALSSCWNLIKINIAVCRCTPPRAPGLIHPHNFSGQSGTEIQPQRPRREALALKPTRTEGWAYPNLSGWEKDKYLPVCLRDCHERIFTSQQFL